MRKYRFHLPGTIHLPISERYMGCAYTQKIVKMSKMMLSLGHEVFLYGAEGSDAPCTEFIQTHTLQDIKDAYGDGSDSELGYDWEKKGYDESKTSENLKTILFPKFVLNCINEINKRKKPDDFFLNQFGTFYRSIEQAVGLKLSVEPGIGYTHSYLPFRAFESQSLMNLTYGGEFKGHIIRPYIGNRVIPNYFDPKDFEYKENKQEFFLYIGRITYAKGVSIAIKTATTLKTKLIIAGQGALAWDNEKGYLKGLEFEETSPYIEYIGYANPETRRTLMANAKAVFVPSLYTEPFGGVNVEAQLSGTPVLATNWGAFPETVVHGKTGFLCNNNDDFIKYAQRVGELKSNEIRAHAERYLMDNVKYEFEDWFNFIYENVMTSQTS